jgi:hypothetical protein
MTSVTAPEGVGLGLGALAAVVGAGAVAGAAHPLRASIATLEATRRRLGFVMAKG